MRLDGFLAGAGLTRKQAKAAVAAGRVTVNGAMVRDPGMRLTDGDRVAIDGQRVQMASNTHIMMNKPAGYVTAREDARALAVMDLLPESLAKRVGPVGRLDKDATGLLLFTSDGQLAHRLISPKRHVEKRYLVTVEGRLTGADVQKMADGIQLSDFTCLPAKLDIKHGGDEESVAEIVIYEGKFHQVKRMFGSLAHPVKSLKRLEIGGVVLDSMLAPGAYRALTEQEECLLYTVMEQK